MKYLKLKYTSLSLALASIFFISCDDNALLDVRSEVPSAISFDKSNESVGVEAMGTTYQVKLQAISTTTVDRTFSISIDPSSTAVPEDYTISSTSITIPAGQTIGSTDVIFDYNVIPLGTLRSLVLNLDPNDNFIFNNTRTITTIEYKAICPYNEVILNMTFDEYPGEVVWWILDASSNMVAASANPLGFGAYDDYNEGDEIEEIFCLESGNYTFIIRDLYKDGAGPFSLTLGGTELFASDGDYGESLAQPFTLP